MKALKILVFSLAGLLVAGFGVLIWGVVTRVHIKGPAAPTAPLAGAPPAGAPFGTVGLALPAGGHLDQVVGAGAFLVVQIGIGDEKRLMVLDPASGQVQGEFRLDAKAR